jgi:hypothetical protein
VIVEVCPFFEETDVLRARLALMDGRTTLLVVEGDRTFQGAPKPYRLDTVWLPAQVHRLRVELPEHGSAWDREQHQRDIARPDWLGDDAVVISCDIDELVDPAALDRITAATEGGPVGLGMRHILFGDREAWPWSMGRAFRGRDWPASLHVLRATACPVIENTGWHLSWLGGLDQRRRKAEATSHSEAQPGGSLWPLIERGETDWDGAPLPVADLSGLPEPLRQLVATPAVEVPPPM